MSCVHLPLMGAPSRRVYEWLPSIEVPHHSYVSALVHLLSPASSGDSDRGDSTADMDPGYIVVGRLVAYPWQRIEPVFELGRSGNVIVQRRRISESHASLA
jgi:hypothetical protein